VILLTRFHPDSGRQGRARSLWTDNGVSRSLYWAGGARRSSSRSRVVFARPVPEAALSLRPCLSLSARFQATRPGQRGSIYYTGTGVVFQERDSRLLLRRAGGRYL